MENPTYRPMSPHDGDPRCVCTDGRQADRDTSEMCNSSRVIREGV